MKKIIILLLAFCGLGSQFLLAQSSLLTTISVAYTLPTGAGPYQPGDEIVVDFIAYNNSGHDIFINPNFELFLDNESQLLVEADPITTGPQTEGSIVFTVPDDCTLEDGAYQLQFFVTYSHNWTQQPAIASTFNGDFDPICNDQDIPVGNPGISEKCVVFTLDLTLQNFPECCTYTPIIDVSVISFSNPPKKFSCRSRVQVSVDLANDDGDPVTYTLEWNNGATTHSFIHDCGNYNYFVTVTWTQSGETCTAVSESVYATSMCGCAYDPNDPGGGGAGPGGGGRGPVSAQENASFEDITSAQLSKATLFPNPNQGHFHLRLPVGKTANSIEVYNLLGQSLMQLSGSYRDDLAIDLNQPEIGTYLLNIRYEDGSSESRKLIVQ